MDAKSTGAGGLSLGIAERFLSSKETRSTKISQELGGGVWSGSSGNGQGIFVNYL
jgi:hypothetical protein